MSRICYLYYATGALIALIGMSWGLHMAISGDHAMAPAHAHLNLLGWVSLGVMGGFYGLAGARVPKWLAWANYLLITIGVAIMAPSLAQELKSHGSGGIGLKVAPILVILGMLCFLAAVIIAGLRARRSAATLGGAPATE